MKYTIVTDLRSPQIYLFQILRIISCWLWVMYKGLSEKMPQRRPQDLTDEELKEIGAKEFNKILKKSGQL